jgi:hypothetical protein
MSQKQKLLFHLCETSRLILGQTIVSKKQKLNFEEDPYFLNMGEKVQKNFKVFIRILVYQGRIQIEKFSENKSFFKFSFVGITLPIFFNRGGGGREKNLKSFKACI